jgi:calcineurin-like phosphoesterase family protein
MTSLPRVIRTSLVALLAAAAVPSVAAAADPVIAAAGDIACAPSDPLFNGGAGAPDNCGERRTSDLIGNVNAVLALGDEQYNSGALSDFNASYDTTWGRFKSITYPVPGNHEYGTSKAGGYFAYFGSRAGAKGQGWYSFDVGSWHILALNSECDRLTGACATGGAEEAWVKADLAATHKACTLAFFHEPRFSSGTAVVKNATAMAPIWTDLYNGRADVVLAGHKHFYERFAPLNATGAVDQVNGMRELIVGTGGEDRAGRPAGITGSEVRDNKTFGVLKVTLHAGRYDWQFVPEPGKTFTDSGSGTCH